MPLEYVGPVGGAVISAAGLISRIIGRRGGKVKASAKLTRALQTLRREGMGFVGEGRLPSYTEIGKYGPKAYNLATRGLLTTEGYSKPYVPPPPYVPRAIPPPSGPPIPPQPPDYPYQRPPPQPTVYAAQQGTTPQVPTGVLNDWRDVLLAALTGAQRGLNRGLELRELLLLLMSFFQRRQPQGITAPGYYELPNQTPIAVSPGINPRATPGGYTMASSMIPGFGFTLNQGVSGAGLGGILDAIPGLLTGGLQLANQLVGQRPSQIPIPGPLGGITLPSYTPEGSVCVPGLFAARERATAQPFEVPNPITGRTVYYAPRGRPLLFSGDFAACKRVARVAAHARRAGGRRRGR
jgi:hypothetical protein